MNVNYETFLIEARDKNTLPAIIRYLENTFPAYKIKEGDSSNYFYDTYWKIREKRWNFDFFYTVLDIEKIRKDKIYIGFCAMKMDCSDEELAIIAKKFFFTLKEKYDPIVYDEIWPDLSDESYEILEKFLKQ